MDGISPIAFQYFVQALGIIGAAASIISVQMKSYEKIIIFRTVYALFFAVQYFLLGGVAAGLMNVIAIVRNILFLYLVKRGRSTLPVQIISAEVFAIIGIFNFEGWMTILITGARIITSFAEGMQNGRLMRLLLLLSSLCWLIYNFSLFSVGGIISEGFSVASVIIALCRFYFFKKDADE